MQKQRTRARGSDSLGKLAALAPLLSADDERRHARAALAGSAADQEALVRSHLRLVLAMASQYRKPGVDLDDLVSEGTLGLVDAIQRFDPERGVRLATYAAWWIRAYMRRFAMDNRRIVRPPSTRHARKLFSNLRRKEHELTQRTGCMPDTETLANALGVAPREVDEIDAILRKRDVSMAPSPDGTTHELACPGPSPETEAADMEEQRRASGALRSAMAGLSERERSVLSARSLCVAPITLAEISREMGVSRERVRQIHERGYEKLKTAVLASVA